MNDKTEQLDKGVENATEDQTMNFYNQDEIPFYYDLAEKFAIDDRNFASVLGPTFPNRSYALAATSFGHLTTSDTYRRPAATGQSPERSSTCWTRTTSLGAIISRMRRGAAPSVPWGQAASILTFCR